MNIKNKYKLQKLLDEYKLKEFDKEVDRLNLIKWGFPSSLSKYSRLATLYHGKIEK